jgi:gliding motility-associated-like protein
LIVHHFMRQLRSLIKKHQSFSFVNQPTNMRHLAKFILLFSFGFLASHSLWATHIRAADITARRISNTALTYEITLTIYYDELGGRAASQGANEVNFCIRPFGASNGEVFMVQRGSQKPINRATTVNIYRTTYTFSSPGRFVISAGIENRNDNIININGGNSVNVPFYVETILEINAALGQNRTPVMLNPPLDSARVGQRFCHNPAAFDADGDSLAYRMTIPKQARTGECVGRNVNYADPALGIRADARNEAQIGPATLSIDSKGNLCWDAPAVPGQYNIAFIIEEWRDGVKIGEIVRDMQIFVTDSPNRRPLIEALRDVCVEANQTVTQTVRATDPDGNRLILTAFGGVFNRDADGLAIDLIAPAIATFTPTTAQNTPATGQFRWVTNCSHVRDQPYDVLFKVEDIPGRNSTQLASFATFSIKVASPKPRGLTVAASGSQGFVLNWNAYACASPGAQMIVYRKEGCSAATYDPCQPAASNAAALGYVEVGRVPIGTTTFTDNNRGLGLRRGVQYSYRIMVLFPLPQGGNSVLSDERCADLPNQMPVLTNVTIDSTSTTRGVITVKWTRPPFASGELPGPYQYRLLRAVGLNGTTFTQIASVNTTLAANADTIFRDRNLNTTDNAYRYRLEFYYTLNGTLTRLDQTEAASSVRLAVANSSQGIRLNWQAVVPWRNENQRHRVYRENRNRRGTFNQIAEVPVQSAATFTYIDDGTDRFLADGNSSVRLIVDSTYCYFVETVGVYDSQRIRVGQLLNSSQIACVSLADSTKPCPPVLRLDSLNCASLDGNNCPEKATNNLTWTSPRLTPQNTECGLAASFNVYFAPYPDEPFTRIGSVNAPINSFQHSNLDSYVGCYYVTSVSRFGSESARSNVVCKDNCALYNLPNVFTPNNDGKNDTFRPSTCPIFIESARCEIVSRAGNKVFESDNPVIDWNGKGSDGRDLPAGTYYYYVTVTFKSLQRQAPTSTFKGWVQLIR